MPLSDSACRGAKPKERPYKVSDGGGLYLQVQPNGSRLWRMAYRYGGKQKTLAFGAYPIVSLVDARERRLRAKKALSAGIDPSTIKHRTEGPDPDSFEFIALEWYDNQEPRWSKSHSTRVLSQLKRDAFPDLGADKIALIEAPKILDTLRKVEARGALEMAKRLHQNIGCIFRYAIATGRASRDPSADLKGALKPSPPVQHQASLKPSEVPEFFERLLAYDGDQQTRLAVELIFHTFVRTKELRFAKWSEFELAGTTPMWRVPADRMKDRLEHLVPLTPQSRALLRRLKKLAKGSEYVLPGKRHGVISENTMLFALYRMGYHSRLTIHGLRGTASTVLNESGLFEPDWIERQLSHVEGNRVRAAYNSAQWLKPRREMMLWWSKWLESKKAVAEMLS